MDAYSCRLINRDGSQDAVDLGEHADLAEAVKAVRNALLVSLSASHAELWRSGEVLIRVSREVAQFRRRAEPWSAPSWTPRPQSGPI